MSEETEIQKEDKNSNLLAALCYLPIAMINVIVILYILLASKKEDKYARFHALQAIMCYLIFIVISSILNAILFFPSMTKASFFGSQATAKAMSENAANIVSMTVPALLMLLVFIFIFVIFAGLALTGKKFKLPIIGNIAEKYA
jgi:uncharacterized membrane protein